MAAPLPRNAWPIARARAEGMRPAGMVLVSLVGDTLWPDTTVYADPGKRYDWTFLIGLPAAIVVRPGIDAEWTIRDVFEVTLPFRAGYPWLVDIEREQLAAVVHNCPIRLWHVKRGGEVWKGWFQ